MNRPLLPTVALAALFMGSALRLPAEAEPAALPAVDRSGTAVAAPPALDLRGYLGVLDQLQAAVEGLSRHPQEAGALRHSLPKSWSVEISGQRYDVPTGYFDGQLARIESNPDQRAAAEKETLSRLSKLRSDALALTAPADPNPATAHAAMLQILGQREYAHVHRPNWLELAWERFWIAVGHLLDRLFSKVGGSEFTRRILVWFIIGGSLAVLLLLLRRWILRTVRRTELTLEASPPAAKDWREWAREALAAGARGEFRNAVHACYWAGVGRLEDLGVWTRVNSRTPREYLRLLDRLGEEVSPPGAPGRLRPAESLAPQRILSAWTPLTGTFERVWYAGEQATVADFRSSLDRLEELGCRFPSNHPTAAS
jgi:hypothetical protein